MALVFLTLIILMFAIMLLDRVFRPKREAAQVRAAPVVAASVTPLAPPAAPVLAADDSDEVAAIGLAIAAAMASAASLVPAARRMATAPAVVFPWDKPRAPGAPAPVGEIVTVVNIDGGSAVWRSQGRLKAAERR
jgi:Na+-transporting methylmalonyl-CoA/oxaloacetate decarboxylase gamma subunit